MRGGRLRANICLEDARLKEILLNYHQTVLLALEEVRTALIRFGKEQERLQALCRAFDSNQETFVISSTLYTNGLVDFVNVLESYRSAVLIEDQIVVTRAKITQNAIALYKALGGGWTIDTEMPCKETGTEPPIREKNELASGKIISNSQETSRF